MTTGMVHVRKDSRAAIGRNIVDELRYRQVRYILRAAAVNRHPHHMSRRAVEVVNPLRIGRTNWEDCRSFHSMSCFRFPPVESARQMFRAPLPPR